MYSQMNCLIENEYIRELSLKKKNTYVFPNELPNWNRILKGKNGKTGKKSWRTLLRGGFIIVNRELAYFIAGGFINAMWTLWGNPQAFISIDQLSRDQNPLSSYILLVSDRDSHIDEFSPQNKLMDHIWIADPPSP